MDTSPMNDFQLQNGLKYFSIRQWYPLVSLWNKFGNNDLLYNKDSEYVKSNRIKTETHI